MKLPTKLAAGLALLTALGAGQAAAQSLSATSASYNAGYGRNPGDEERGVTNFGMRDENGNLISVNGLVTSSASAGAAASAAAWGVGFGGAGTTLGGWGQATAIGNNLNVTVQGNWNTVIVVTSPLGRVECRRRLK
jgi:holdfast attachment protein HfaA